MNNKQEKTYLESLEKALSSQSGIVNKQWLLSWALFILGCLTAFGLQFHAGYKPEIEMHNGIYILSGCLIGFGWNLMSNGSWAHLHLLLLKNKKLNG